MENTILLYYAAICGALAGVAPMLGNKVTRVGLGACVGVIAALIYPYMKSVLGL